MILVDTNVVTYAAGAEHRNKTSSVAFLRRVYDTIRALFPAVVPVTAEITDQARKIMDGDRSLLARHSLHAAVVLSRGFETICSFDGDFDRISRVVRNEPEELWTKGGSSLLGMPRPARRAPSCASGVVQERGRLGPRPFLIRSLGQLLLRRRSLLGVCGHASPARIGGKSYTHRLLKSRLSESPDSYPGKSTCVGISLCACHETREDIRSFLQACFRGRILVENTGSTSAAWFSTGSGTHSGDARTAATVPARHARRRRPPPCAPDSADYRFSGSRLVRVAFFR